MRFFRFRDRSATPAPTDDAREGAEETEESSSAARAADSADEADEEIDYAVPDEETDEDTLWRDRAAAVIPGGASTGSKRPEALYGEAGTGPTHFMRARGCEVVTASGAKLVDCTMALGAVALGYADEAVTQHVIGAVAAGSVSGLSHALEVEVAERLCDTIPCAEAVRFLKTGAEATAAAVRIARTATGRSTVVGSGYFGWLDWCTDAPGVPPAARERFVPVPWGDIASLEQATAAAGDDLAAVILEPVVERLPDAGWIAAARAICDRRGAVLIFDEIKTGFRLRRGGYMEESGVLPDLATFGKAMANGFPLAAVVGKGAVMDAARRTWISSTLAGEATALAAATVVLDRHDERDVCGELAAIGAQMRAAVAEAIERSGVGGVTLDGIDPMWLLRWDDPARQSRFQELALAQGVLFKRGAYNFSSLAHDDRALLAIERAASNALVELRDEERGSP